MRQFVSDVGLDKNGKLIVTGKDFKYLACVLRIRVGNILEVRLPSDEIKQMSVVKITSSSVVFTETGVVSTKNCSTNGEDCKNLETGVSASKISETFMNNFCEIWMFQLMPKMQTFDEVIRHAVECGVSRIIPIKADYSKVSDCSDSRQSRWLRVAKEARQQSGSPVNTQIDLPCTLAEACEKWHKATMNKKSISFVLHESISENTKSVFSMSAKPEIAAFVVGCEGGMSSDELNLLVQNNFSILHFNTNVLRVDTAAIYGLAVIQHAIMEFDVWHTKE